MKAKKLVYIFLLVFILSGCEANVQLTPPPSASPLNTVAPTYLPSPSAAVPSIAPSKAPQTMSIGVFYLKESANELFLVREEHTLIKSEGVARAALNELISGTVLTKGAFKILPENTKVLGIKIDNGLATVDFSKEVLKSSAGAAAEELGILSIVNTLTEFPTIQKVQFTVEGSFESAKDWWGHVGLYNQPFQRDLMNVFEPAIWVTAPVSGQKVSGAFTLKGNARVFEAMVSYRLKDTGGKVLAQGSVMATGGAPGRGDFSKLITFAPTSSGGGLLEVFEESMKDGSDINKIIIPLSW